MGCQIGVVSSTPNEPPDSANNSRRIYEHSLHKLQTAIDELRLKKPDFLDLGGDMTLALSNANVNPFSEPEMFQEVVESAMQGIDKKRNTFQSMFASSLARIAPIAGIALGITGFAGDAAGIGPLGHVATGLGAVLAYAIQEKERGEDIVNQLNNLSYSRRYVEKIIKVKKCPDKDLVDACFQLLATLNNFLRTSLQYLARSLMYNLLRGLVGGRAIDECRTALKDALAKFDLVLQRTANLIILETGERYEQQELLKWFSQLSFKEIQAKHRSERCDGTGEWFLGSDEVQQFMEGKLRWLWCTGRAGVGKTILMSSLVGNLEHQIRDNRDAGKKLLSYIFCDINDQQRQDAEALFGSIACQVVEARLGDLYQPALSFREVHQGSPPKLTDFMDFIEQSVPEGFQLLILVDALDELSDMEQFVKSLNGLLGRMSNKLSIVTTMRPESCLRHGLRRGYDRSLEIKTPITDLTAYVKGRISRKKPILFDMDYQTEQTIIDTIVDKADNRFILGRLQLDSLYCLRPGSKGDLDHELSNLSLKLDEFYEKSLTIINKDKDVLRLLSWLLVVPKPLDFADLEEWERIHPTQRRGPLSIQELRHALAIRCGRTTTLRILQEHMLRIRYIVGLSGGLCTLDQNGGTITFTHPTVQEYLIGKKPDLFPNLEADRCRACLAYLSLDEFKAGACTSRAEWDARLESFPFLEYAARNWCEIRGLTSTWDQVNNEIEDDIVGVLSHEGLVANLAQVNAYSRGWMTGTNIYIPRTTGLIVAMEFNLLGVMKRLCASGVDVNVHSETGQTALDLAVTAEPPYVELLLQHGAKVTDETGRSALRIVEGLPRRRLNGGDRIVNMLLEADPTLQRTRV